MKTIRLIIAGLVMTMGFSSCSSLFYDAKVDVLNSIQKGDEQAGGHQDIGNSRVSPLRPGYRRMGIFQSAVR